MSFFSLSSFTLNNHVPVPCTFSPGSIIPPIFVCGSSISRSCFEHYFHFQVMPAWAAVRGDEPPSPPSSSPSPTTCWWGWCLACGEGRPPPPPPPGGEADVWRVARVVLLPLPHLVVKLMSGVWRGSSSFPGSGCSRSTPSCRSRREVEHSYCTWVQHWSLVKDLLHG